MSIRMTTSTWIFVAIALASLAIGTAVGLGYFEKSWLLLAIGIAGAAVSFLVQNRAARNLPQVTDEEFLRSLDSSISDQDLVAERRRVASILCVPAVSLRADQKLESLTAGMDFMGVGSVAVNDIIMELEELEQDAGSNRDTTPIETIGQLVIGLAAARKTLKAKRS